VRERKQSQVVEGTLVVRRGDALAETWVAGPDDHVAGSLRARSSSTENIPLQLTPAGPGPLERRRGEQVTSAARVLAQHSSPFPPSAGIIVSRLPRLCSSVFDVRVALPLHLFRLRVAYVRVGGPDDSRRQPSQSVVRRLRRCACRLMGVLLWLWQRLWIFPQLELLTGPAVMV